VIPPVGRCAASLAADCMTPEDWSVVNTSDASDAAVCPTASPLNPLPTCTHDAQRTRADSWSVELTNCCSPVIQTSNVGHLSPNVSDVVYGALNTELKSLIRLSANTRAAASNFGTFKLRLKSKLFTSAQKKIVWRWTRRCKPQEDQEAQAPVYFVVKNVE